MPVEPLSETLQRQYRSTMNTSGAPAKVDNESTIVPVAVVAQVNTASSASFTQVTDGNDTMLVNTDGSINVVIPSWLPTKQITVANGTRNGTAFGTTTLGTVGASKTWYIVAVSASLASQAAAASRDCQIDVQANGVTILTVNMSTTATAGAGGVANAVAMEAPTGMYIGAALTSGQTITLVTSGSASAPDRAAATVYYIEV